MAGKNDLLEVGGGAMPAPSPNDAKANPLAPPPAQRAEVLRQFDSAEEQAAVKFNKLKELQGQMAVVQAEFSRLAALKDTVTEDDVVEAAAAVVAAGLPAVQVAASLAEAPQNSEALQAWVAKKQAEAAQQNQQLQAAMAVASWELAQASFQSILADSVEGFHARKRKMH